MAEQEKSKKREINKKLVIKALTDPKFRKQLQSDPKAALGAKEFTAAKKREVKAVLSAVKSIDAHIGALADLLLCNNGGGCSIA